MNTLEQNISDLVLWIKTTATATQGFVTEQTPLYIREFLSWYFWEAMFYTSISAALLCVTLSVALWASKKYSKLKAEELKKDIRYNGASENFQIAMAFALVASAVLLVPLSINAHNALKVKVAPRVVLVEEIAHKLK
ncbi:MAG: hypothetical protein EBU90_00195 [Proteobacteria bacterium]|nr:hypothetical protein [Pseudomonadota bacterium]NBP12852.1 hypothetical protein [bacterium]